MKELLTVRNLSKGKILKAISFELREGEMVAVMGPSGSGKSTLLYNVSGMDRADGGEVRFDGTEIVGLSEDEKARLRLHKMGFVFQQMNVLANLNLIDNIVLPAMHAMKNRKRELHERARALMDDFGIGDLAERRVNEVSGGQLQRACICRSLMMEPEIIFADEPTGALNRSAAADVIETFLKINRKGTTVLMVTHDGKNAAVCDRILYLLDGEIRGELKLGKHTHDDAKEREIRTLRWLEEMGW
ncbi:MAG: ABC transporter ATP-binding protein [Spirochaetales bacterium]|nr:ABC transporter ATP-binding protein [Spirochaetales bacterium]